MVVKDALTVGGVATAAGVSADAVRYYEKLRLLARATRAPSGYRVFDIGVVDRIRAIRRAQALGMSLAEIGDLFPQDRLGRAECRRVRGMLAEKIALTDARIADLRSFRLELRSSLNACDRAIAGRGDAPCPLFVPRRFSAGSRAIRRRGA